MHRRKILLVEDDEDTRFAVSSFLQNQGYAVHEAESCTSAEVMVRATRPHLIVADYQLPDGNALDLLERVQRLNTSTPLILLTGNGSIDLAVEAMKRGAEHFLTKPVSLPALHAIMEKALEKANTLRQQEVQRATRVRESLDPFVGTSVLIRELRSKAERIAGADRPVCIFGETGSGKGVLARWLHENSSRSNAPMIELNCAGLPGELLESEVFGHERGAFTGAVVSKIGLMEAADGGTLFLDEIGDMSAALQPKLLKAVEDGHIRRIGDTREIDVDVRLIAATHRNLLESVRLGQFREDLYFRLTIFTLQLPPLRERREDIVPIAETILGRLAMELSRSHIELSSSARKALEAHAWPGNIRELRNILERALLMAADDEIEPSHLSFDGRTSSSMPKASTDATLAELEEMHIRRVVEEEQGNVDRSAVRLGLSRSSLYQKLKAYRIER